MLNTHRTITESFEKRDENEKTILNRDDSAAVDFDFRVNDCQSWSQFYSMVELEGLRVLRL